MRTCFMLCWSLGLGLLGAAEIQARSTVMVRFTTQAVAGPDIRQTAMLLVRYFPGDGEAVLRTEIDYDASLFTLGSAASDMSVADGPDPSSAKVVEAEGVKSALGQVRTVKPVLRIDYGQNPISGETVDTLWVGLRAAQSGVESVWTARIYSSLDPEGVAHQISAELGVRRPLDLAVEVHPRRLFPGEELDLEIALANRDGDGRSADRVRWQWPAGIKVLKEPSGWPWDQPLEAGQTKTQNWRVYIESDKPGELQLDGVVDAAAVSGSPVPASILQIAPIPQVGIGLETDFLKVGQDAQLTFEWTNPGSQIIEVAELLIDIPQEFGGVVPEPGTLEATVVEPEGQGGKSVLVEGVGRLEGGQRCQLTLQARPLRPGPFTWKSSFRPVGHDEFIDVPGPTKVQVVLVRPERDAARQTLDQATDLQLMSRALVAAMERDLGDLRLQPGSRIYLQPNSKGDDNWVVEDGLMQVLRRRGHTIVLKEPEKTADLATVTYRLLEARVVYTAVQKGWNPFHADYRREALGDLLVRAEDRGGIRFINRVRAYMVDEVEAADRELLGGSDIVDSKAIELEHKMIERGLSASILSGLFYIFFVP